MATADLVLITRRGGGDPRLVPCDGASASWEVSAAGVFSAFVSLADLPVGIAPTNLRGRWLRWEHPTAGAWGGIVTSVSRDGSAVEIGATGFADLTRGRVVRRSISMQAASPGSTFRRLLSEMAREEPSWLTLVRADEDGAPVAISLAAGEPFDDVIAQIADQSGTEWRVDADRNVEYAQEVGRDLTSSVCLYEGVQVAEHRWVDDYWAVQNQLVGFGAEPERERGGGRLEGAVVADAASVARFGPVEGSLTYLDTRSAITIAPRLKRELARTADPPAIVELTILDVGGVFAHFREGDRFRVVLGSAQVAATFRPMVRAIDEEGVMALSGTAVPA